MTKAEILYKKLIDSNIVGAQGQVTFLLEDIEIISEDKNIIGNLIQAWLPEFMRRNNVLFWEKANPQEWPDFFLSVPSNSDLLEVKAFTKNPNFDISDFISFCRSLTTHKYRLDADYLIFEYTFENKTVKIKNVWLKKLWEITGGSKRSSIKINWKQDRPYNIRPINWYGDNVEFHPFNEKQAMLKAMDKTLKTQSGLGDWAKDWLKKVS